MSGRSKTKSIKSSRQKNEENKFDKPESLTLQDVQCTVCMGIFIEPVTLPCYHTTCKVCFEKTINNNTLACPLCRKYIGGWIRQRQKNGLLVNQALWAHIREHFEIHVKKKLKGEDDEVIDGLHEQNIPAPKICEPGLIRQEYEAERKRIEDEAQKYRDLEAQASAKLIKELQEREEQERLHLEELRKKAEEEDALIAKKIAAELQEEEARKEAEEQESLRQLLEEEQAHSAFVRLPFHPMSTPSSQPSKKGPMDAFLSQCNLRKPSRTGSSSSTDSLNSELHHFKPVHYVPTTPPKSSPGGSDSDSSQVCKPKPVMSSLELNASPSIVGPSSSSLRPWLLKDYSYPSSSNVPKGRTLSVPSKGKRKQRSPSGIADKSPKRTKRESPRKMPRLEPMTTITSNFSRKQKSSHQKAVMKDSDSGRETDCEEELDNSDGPGSSSLNECSSFESTRNSFKSKSIIRFDGGLLPLSLDDMTESREMEERYRQEQEDYKLALKLQQEFNSVVQSRTYDLRSVVSIPASKSQNKLATPARKLRPKPSSSATKPSKRRQCTLEESMGFSVKMGL